MKYTVEHLAAISAKLSAMPAIEKKQPDLTKQEVIKGLAKEISAMQKRGYSLEQVSEALRGEGLAITTPTLKSYLQRAKPVKKVATTKPTNAVQKSNTSNASFNIKADSDEI